MDWQGWLDKVAVIEAANPDKRVVSVSIPGGLPSHARNVPNRLYRGNIPLDNANVADMREGVYGTFRVTAGPFRVRFNTGESL
jgi:hypothetical protein